MRTLIARFLAVLLALFVVSSFTSAVACAVDIEDPCGDTTSPYVLSVIASTDATNTRYSATVTFSETVTDFALTSIENLGGSALTLENLSGSGTTYTFDVASGPEGQHRIHVIDGSVHDVAGNTSVGSNDPVIEDAVLYDTTPPVVTVTNAPTHNSSTQGPVQFEMSSTDSSATFTCTFTPGSVPGGVPFPCGPGESSVFTPSELTDGVYTFTVFGTDDLGNAGTPATDDGTLITFTYDTSFPEVHIVTPVPSPTSVAPVLIVSSNEPVTLAFFGPCGSATPTTIPAGNSALTFSTLPPGTYSTRPQYTEQSETTVVTQVPILEGEPEKAVYDDSDYAHMCIFSATDAAGHTVYHSIATFVVTAPSGGGGSNGPVTIVTSNSGNTSPTVTMIPSGPQPGEGNRILSGQTGSQSGAPQFASVGTGSGSGTGGGEQVTPPKQPQPKAKSVVKQLKKAKQIAKKSAPKLPDPLTPPPAGTQTAGAATSGGPLWNWLTSFFGY